MEAPTGEVSNRQRYNAYMAGWTAGSGVKPIRYYIYSNHPDLKSEYNHGWENGRRAYREVSEHKAKSLGIELVPLAPYKRADLRY